MADLLAGSIDLQRGEDLSITSGNRSVEASVREIPGPAGGALRVEGDLHRAGENSGGTWGAIERREIGGRRIKGGR